MFGPGLIRIRLDPIYSQLTERKTAASSPGMVVSISRKSKGESHPRELVTTAPRYFDLIHPVPAISIPWLADRWTISNPGVAQFSFLLEIGCWAGVRVIPSRCKRETKNIYIYIKEKRWNERRRKKERGKRRGGGRIKIKGDGYRREWSNLESQLF